MEYTESYRFEESLLKCVNCDEYGKELTMLINWYNGMEIEG